MQNSILIPIRETTQVGEARRVGGALAADLGFGEVERGQVAIVMTEAATNLLKHAGGGELLLRGDEQQGVGIIDLLALDRGGGMANVAQCLRDGYSSSGSSGTGLGAMSRLAERFEVHSVEGGGTALYCRLAPRRVAQRLPEDDVLELGLVCLPRAGQEVCGDGWAVQRRAGKTTFLVSDGLGHGPLAAEASREAIRVFLAHPGASPAEVLEMAHGALRKTRGAACLVVELDRGRRLLRHAGVGNVAGWVIQAEGSQGLISHNGTLGAEVRKLEQYTLPWPANALLVLHTDGLGTQWRLDAPSGLLRRHPTLISGVLYRDFARGRDDVTVLVAREAASVSEAA